MVARLKQEVQKICIYIKSRIYTAIIFLILAVITGALSDIGSSLKKTTQAYMDVLFSECVSSSEVIASKDIYQIGIASHDTEAGLANQEWVSNALQKMGGVKAIRLCERIASDDPVDSINKERSKALAVIANSGLDAIIFYKTFGEKVQFTFAHRIQGNNGQEGFSIARLESVINSSESNDKLLSYINDSILLTMSGMLFEYRSDARRYPEKLMTMLEKGFHRDAQVRNFVEIISSLIADAAKDAALMQLQLGMSTPSTDRVFVERLNKLSSRLGNYLDDRWALSQSGTDDTICWLAFQRSMIPHLISQINNEKSDKGIEALFSIINELPPMCSSVNYAMHSANNMSKRLELVFLLKALSNQNYSSLDDAKEAFNTLTEVAKRFKFISSEDTDSSMDSLKDVYAMQMLIVLDSIEDVDNGSTAASSWSAVANMLRHNLSKTYPIVNNRVHAAISDDPYLAALAADQASLYMRKILYFASTAVADVKSNFSNKNRHMALARISAELSNEGRLFRGDVVSSPFTRNQELTVLDMFSDQEYAANLFMKRFRMKYILDCTKNNSFFCRIEASSEMCRYFETSVKCN